MSTTPRPLHRTRHVTARCFAYGALTCFAAFLYFICTDFGGNAWTIWGFGSIILLIAANAISHPANSDERTLLRRPKSGS